jgi:hypothetical protein
VVPLEITDGQVRSLEFTFIEDSHVTDVYLPFFEVQC